MALDIDLKKTAFLVLDCENDIVHRDGKAGGPEAHRSAIEILRLFADVVSTDDVVKAVS